MGGDEFFGAGVGKLSPFLGCVEGGGESEKETVP